MTDITPERVLTEMIRLSELQDREQAHAKADELLCDIAEAAGYGEAVAVFMRANWWYA